MSTSAGWYPDSKGQQRYWDGSQWTEHTAPGQAPAAPPPPAGATYAPLPPDDRRRKNGRTLKVLGWVVAAIVAIALLGAIFGGDDTDPAASDSDDSTSADQEPAPEKKAEPEKKKPAKPKYTVAQANAIRSGKSYLAMAGMSRLGLIQQLSSKAGEGFKRSDAVFAADHIKVDWNKEAVQSAKSYLEMGGMSRASLIQQLSSKAGEQFTQSQAAYAADKVGLK